MNLKTHYSANELADFRLKSLPHTVQGVSYQARNNGWIAQKRVGKGGGKEYAFDSLPMEVQAEIRQQFERSLGKSAIELRYERAESRRTALAMRDVSKFSQKQRDQADARMVMASYVLRLQDEKGLHRKPAIALVAKQSQTGELPEHLQKFAALAVARKSKKQGFGTRVLQQWVIDYDRCRTPTERLAAFAPAGGSKHYADPAHCPWLADFMAVYRNTNGVCVTEAYHTFARAWAIKKPDSRCPTLRQVQYMLNKLPKHIKEIGRKTGAQLRALKTYVKRDWSTLQANDVWVGDGHSMKLKVKHPIHGQPFTPELTLVIDAASRFIVGWSLAFSENTIAVADALRCGMHNWGIPAIYYSDNGGGQANKTIDADITGIFDRLGVHHETGIPGNPQGRGIIERLNHTLALRIARQFETYYGGDADETTVHKTNRAVKSYAKALNKGTAEEDMTDLALFGKGKLPTWDELLEQIRAGVKWYNEEHKHSAIGNVTPWSVYLHSRTVADSGSIVSLTEAEARDMFRPQEVRTVRRGWLSYNNNDYWHADLENRDGEKVVIAIDIHDAGSVIVRDMDGNYICDAICNGNKRQAFPQSLVEKKREERATAAIARAEEKIALAKAELKPALEHDPLDMLTIKPKTPAVEADKIYDFLEEPKRNHG
ncbi:MAG: transposase [Gammaproteobacteria bacterium]|nr:MAG: transposase [Gammaproteobacteria bacterium]